jgi:hypothetical protein
MTNLCKRVRAGLYTHFIFNGGLCDLKTGLPWSPLVLVVASSVLTQKYESYNGWPQGPEELQYSLLYQNISFAVIFMYPLLCICYHYQLQRRHLPDCGIHRRLRDVSKSSEISSHVDWQIIFLTRQMPKGELDLNWYNWFSGLLETRQFYFGLHEAPKCLDQLNNKFLSTAFFSGTR